MSEVQSFGDDTISACIRTELKNVDIFREESDIGKYFKDTLSITSVNNSNKSSAAHDATQAEKNISLRNPDAIGKNLNQCVVSDESNIAAEQNNMKENVEHRSIRSRLRKNAYMKKNYGFYSINQENHSANRGRNKSQSNRSTLLKQCGRPVLSGKTENSNGKSNTTHSTSTDASSVKLSASSVLKHEDKSTFISHHTISTVPTQDRYKLSSWGLPPNILQKYEARGVSNMFSWQVECLSNRKVLEEKRNLVYSAPTSAGKTLVAEVLIIKTVLERQKKAIFILPFVSVVREKMYYFQDLLSDCGVRVEGFMGGIVPAGGFAATQVAIATIEKANSLVNRLMEENELVNLGAVVIDELHLVGDPNRGYLLELLLTKLKYMNLRDENVNIQLIGMSATLPNLSLLAEWLDAELYKTDFRPIPLNEQCKIGTSIYDNKMNLVRDLIPMPELTMDTDNVMQLCFETISGGHSVLIFCPTKNWCEKLSEQIAATFFKLGREDTRIGEVLREQLNSELISETLEQLKRSPIGLDNVLRNTVSFGVAFHHAGLTMDERDIIEGSFRSGSLRVLVATSTLSSGVNLPARRVIVRSPMFGGKLIDTLTYKQMIGRAGRMGKDTAGESILMCKSNERKAAESLLISSLNPIESCLEDSGPLIRALLEAIASEVVFTPSDLELYTKCTLVSLSGDDHAQNPTKEAIRFLVDNEFLLLQNTGEECRWVATALGKACLAASVPPKDGLFLLEELQKARRCFVLDTELHVVYLVTPLSSGSQISTIDWMMFLELWRTLPESERRVGQLVGVEERFLTSAVKGIVRPGKVLSIHRRFYAALALHDLVRETPLNTVCKKYGCCRGVLQSLQQSAATFAGMVTQFCKQLGWDCMELLVSQFQTRLQFGVCRELLDLLRLPMLNGLRARSLYKQGITCIADLAVANELDVERALYKALPFESEKEQDGEHESDAIKRNKMRTVFVTGKDGLTPHEAAIMLVQEARALVQNELGLQNLSWRQNDQSSVTSESSVQTNTQLRPNTFGSSKCTNTKTAGEILSRNSFHQVNNVIPDLCVQNATKETSFNSMDAHESLIDIKLCDAEERKISANTSNNFKSCNEDILNQTSERNDDVSVRPTDQTLQLDPLGFLDSPTKKYSFDFFNDSSPKMKDSSERNRDSESLISFKDTNKNRTQNATVEHAIDDVRDIEKIDNNPPNKKLRTSVVHAAENPNTFGPSAIDSDLQNSARTRVSRSPSLFDDSFNLDTQMCNVLEQNIDALCFATFEEAKPSQAKLSITDVRKNTRDIISDNKAENDKFHAEDTSKNNRIPKTSSFDMNTQTKQSVFSWKDDSWNEPKVIIEKLNHMNNKADAETPNKHSIRNIKNVNFTHAMGTPGTSNSASSAKKKHEIESEMSANISENLKRISQKRKFKEVPVEKSPVANVIMFNRNRAASLDSNKSDSDDIIIASQHINSPAPSTKIRSRIDSEKKLKMLTQKLSRYLSDEVKEHPNVITSTEMAKNRDQEDSPKLNKITAQNILPRREHSIDSVVSNSDEGTPVKLVKASQKSKISLKKVQTNSEKSSRPTKSKDNANKTANWNRLNVIHVGSDRGTFNLFKRELMKRQYIALALSCEMYTNDVNNIGSKIVGASSSETKRKTKKDNYVFADRKLCGAAISWDNDIAYYISFSNRQDSKVTGREQMKLLKEIFSNTLLNVKCFATKEACKTLYRCCGIFGNCRFLDPKVASWLYDASVYEKTFNELVVEHFPEGRLITKRVGPCYDTGPGLNIKSSLPGEFRASAEAILTWHLADALLSKLENCSPQLLYAFKEIEMKTVTLLACMELTGLGVSLRSLQDLSSVIRDEMTSLENRAYSLSGRRFNFSSSKAVGEVLGLYKGKKISVNKAVLEQSDHPISSLVTSWRKLSATQSKIIQPLLRLAQHEPRIHGNCVTCTLTGRVSMHEPNLQNVPKDFNSEDNSFVISVRMAFVPAIGNVILTADYCQLELRILAHFSKDTTLCDIMRKPGDIFKNIAAKWNQVSEEKVDDKMRQRTKQLCYGMIYGMGVKTLAENLSVEETEAKVFLESFMNTYPEIQQWLNGVVEEARGNGYVTTLFGRRRMLPGLASTKPAEKSQAERQAVNTKVQGSAADIAKKAMVDIDDKMRDEVANSARIMPKTQMRRLRSNSREAQERGGYLILQLHDELLYEVNINDLHQVAAIVKKSMEKACELTVPLPIKIKVGPAWGDLSEYTFLN